ncbi:hypothetical protein XELAEV_18031003mg [Xenopus laevis]|uniref:Uncharacterized protein n=1 Tax=Xenopus laevis TaxID=8355 RepID=A0A974CNB0_XENLA|nr:hypothetical protein XELAEV_18031003mg [Xenopus laevis]
MCSMVIFHVRALVSETTHPENVWKKGHGTTLQCCWFLFTPRYYFPFIFCLSRDRDEKHFVVLYCQQSKTCLQCQYAQLRVCCTPQILSLDRGTPC